MNKNDFLNRLISELTQRRVQNTAEILLDFDLHFKEAMEAGQSEEQVCEMLGDPAEIAEQYVELNTYIDLRDGSGKGESAHGSGIFTDLTSASLIIDRSSNDDFEVRIKKNGVYLEHDELDDFSIECGHDFVSVSQARHENFILGWLGMFEIKTVIISVPRRFYGEMSLKLISGNVEIVGVERATNVRADVLSGNIKVEGLGCDELHLKTKSGNVKVTGCTGRTYAKSFSGGVSVLSHSGYVNAESISGGVHVETDVIDCETTFSTKSGSIKVSVAKLLGDMTVKCVSGSINLTVYELRANIAGSTVSGMVKAHFGHETQAVFNTSSSSTRNDFASGTIPNPGGLPYVNLSTRSGMVKIKRI